MEQLRKYDRKLMVKGKKTDLINLALRKFTIPMAEFIAKYTNIMPNQITIANIFVMILSLLFLAISGYTSSPYTFRLIGGVLAFVVAVLDHLDGKLARALKTASIKGKWLDEVPEFLYLPFVIICLAIGLRIDNATTLIIAMLAAVSFPIHYLIIYNFKSEMQPIIYEKRVEVVKKDNKLRYVYGGHIMLFILLPVCIAVEKPNFIFWFFAIAENLFWIAIVVLHFNAVNKYEKLIRSQTKK